MNRRGRAQPPRASRPPTTHIATGPAEVWCWDVTFLPAQIQGRWFYLYLILDLYSRKIVGFEVHDTDSADHAACLARRTALAEGVHAMPARPVLHGDNGATLKATTVLAMLHWLGIKPSYSRPRVSDDNPFVEALFRTVKYRPAFPLKGFADLQAARDWSARFSGTITTTTTAESATSPRRSAMPGRMVLCSPPATPSTGMHGSVTPGAGVRRPATGHRLAPERDAVVRAAASQIQLSGSIGEPAFPSRPGNAQATARNAGDGRSGATRSHAQSALAREHGEDGEHRTFRGTLIASRGFASPDIRAATTAASPIGKIIA
jgi:putative transposase